MCTAKFVSIASSIVFAPVAQIKISWMSGVPGPAWAPPPKIFPKGNGNLNDDSSDSVLNSGWSSAFDADSIDAIVTAKASAPPISE